MNFFGMGPTEFLVIAVIAFIVFGPEKFAELAKTFGKFVREVRSMSGGITGEFRDAMNEFQQVSGEFKQVSGEIQDTTRSLLVTDNPPTNMTRSLGSGATQPAFVRPAADATAQPTKSDPLADFGTLGEATPATDQHGDEKPESSEPRSNESAA